VGAKLAAPDRDVVLATGDGFTYSASRSPRCGPRASTRPRI
jgi:hypothetical protein